MNGRHQCRGRAGVPHDLHIRIGLVGRKREEHGHPTCHEVTWNSRRWSCGHEEYCDQCGKVMSWYLPPLRCPLYGNKREKENARVDEFANGA